MILDQNFSENFNAAFYDLTVLDFEQFKDSESCKFLMKVSDYVFQDDDPEKTFKRLEQVEGCSSTLLVATCESQTGKDTVVRIFNNTAKISDKLFALVLLLVLNEFMLFYMFDVVLKDERSAKNRSYQFSVDELPDFTDREFEALFKQHIFKVILENLSENVSQQLWFVLNDFSESLMQVVDEKYFNKELSDRLSISMAM